MRSDVEQVGGARVVLEEPEPEDIANIRFRPENVEIFDPRQRVVGNPMHRIARRPRFYHPFDWIDEFPEIDAQPPQRDEGDPRRSEKERTRAAQEGSTVDPRHVRLQNRLYNQLCEKHGRANVYYERNFVDLTLEEPAGCTFFEIKMEPTVKGCVRLAMGQLLEYAHYPKGSRARHLVVIGDAPPTENDRSYMGLLRKKYRLPIYYSRVLWESNELSQEI